MENISVRYKEWIILQQKKQQKNGGYPSAEFRFYVSKDEWLGQLG
jgi:hypothetical protein